MIKTEPSAIKNKTEFTWPQIQQHNKYNDCWLVIDDVVYDVTKWAPKHPGGDMILLAGGTDATIMVNSYHVTGIKNELLSKYQIGIVKGTKEENRNFYDGFTNDEFYNTLKERVSEYFSKNNIKRGGEGIPLMYLKGFLMLTFFFVSVYYMNFYGSYIAAFGVGLFGALVGMNLMHDGSHGSFSRVNILNTIACGTMDLFGASSFVWESQHVAGHHLWTNLENDNKTNQKNSQRDPDVFSSYPLVRMHPSSERKWFHAYQHYYSPVLFMVFTMAKVLYNDFACFYDNQVMHVSMNQRLSDKNNLYRIAFMKSLTFGYLLFAPIYLQGFKTGLLLFVIAHLTVGTVLAYMFIVTHITEGAVFPEMGVALEQNEVQQKYLEESRKKFGITSTKKASEHSWAALQCKTSVNWSLGSVFWTNFSGGLNHQIEHHLLPGICHMHYPQIQQIVEKTCCEYQVPYMHYNTIYKATRAMLAYLKFLGQPDQKKKQ